MPPVRNLNTLSNLRHLLCLLAHPVWWQSHRIREGEKGLGAVQSGVGATCVFARMFLALCSRFEGKKHMGFLLRWGQKCRLVDFWRKRQVCGATSARKVPTRGFSAKKEVVWRNLSAIFHHSAKKEGGWRDLSRIFGRKGNGVARPPCQHGEKGRCVARPQKSAKISLFLCLPVQIKCSHGRCT